MANKLSQGNGQSNLQNPIPLIFYLELVMDISGGLATK